MSSLSRAFTTRRVKQSIDLSDAARGRERSNIMQRSKTTKGHPAVRHKISAPMELVHTTNMLSYNAPDIRPQTNSGDNSSTKSSEDDSDSVKTAGSSPPTSPDVAPHELTSHAEPNHLSCYFVAPGQALNPSKAPEVPKIPSIPKRAPSHTKQASFDAIARQRSASTLSKSSEKTVSSKASMTSRASSGSSAASTMSHNSVAPSPKAVPPMPSPAFQQHHQQPRQERPAESHPFGRELAQVTEIAEGFGVKDRVMDEEERVLKAKGLCKFGADEYLAEVQSLFTSFFHDSHAPQRPMAAAWI